MTPRRQRDDTDPADLAEVADLDVPDDDEKDDQRPQAEAASPPESHDQPAGSDADEGSDPVGAGEEVLPPEREPEDLLEVDEELAPEEGDGPGQPGGSDPEGEPTQPSDGEGGLSRPPAPPMPDDAVVVGPFPLEPTPGDTAEPLTAAPAGRGPPLSREALEDAVLMGLQAASLDDAELENRLLEALSEQLAASDLEGTSLEVAVLSALQAEIEDPETRQKVLSAVKAEIAAAKPEGPAEPAQAGAGGDQGPEVGEDAVEDAVLMGLQSLRLEDAELEGQLLEAMHAVLEEPPEDAPLDAAVLEAIEAEIEDPELREQVAGAISSELDTARREAQAQAGSQDATDGADEAPEIEPVDAEVDEVEVEELDEEIEEVDVALVEEVDIEPEEGMPELTPVDEPEPRAPREATEAPQTTDRETRELVKEISEEHERRIEAALAEAKELEKQAKDIEKKAKADKQLREEYRQHAEYVAEMASELGFDPDRPITQIPEITDPDIQELEFSTIRENYSYIRILYNEVTSRYLYQVIEPQLNQTEQDVLEFLRDTLVRTMDGRRGDKDEGWDTYLEQEVERAILDHSILVDQVGKQRLQYYIKRDFLGYGPIDVIMQDPMIEDISCDGPGIPIYVFHRQYESTKTNVVFEDETELDSFVISLAQRSGKHISIAEPMLDATLPDTSRLQATLSREVTTRGSSFTIRKFRSDPLTPPDLIRLGTMSSRMAAFLWMAMEDGSPMIMAGGTASGKTTTLNSMCQFIPPTKKVVSIEDTREVNLIHENWIAGLTRAGFAGREGEGSVDMYRLLEAALRQRPEFLIVGEVRGQEAQTLFQAMATGHATYSTLHADSVRSAVYRLENPPIDVPRMMLQTLDGIAVQVQARVGDRLVRRIKSFTEIIGIDARTGDLLTNQVYEWNPDNDEYEFLGKSHILDRRMERESQSPKEVEEEWANRALVMDWMVEKGIRHIEDVSNILAAYYARPDAVLERVRSAMDPEDVKELLPADALEQEGEVDA